MHVRNSIGTDEILGATICGPNAGDMISEITICMQYGIGVAQISGEIKMQISKSRDLISYLFTFIYCFNHDKLPLPLPLSITLPLSPSLSLTLSFSISLSLSLSGTIHPYPTTQESVRQACLGFNKHYKNPEGVCLVTLNKLMAEKENGKESNGFH